MDPITHSTGAPARSDARYEEWLLDDAIDDTFPASDPISHGQPGSIINVRYAARERRDRNAQRHLANLAPWWILIGATAAGALLLVRRRARQRTALR